MNPHLGPSPLHDWPVSTDRTALRETGTLACYERLLQLVRHIRAAQTHEDDRAAVRWTGQARSLVNRLVGALRPDAASLARRLSRVYHRVDRLLGGASDAGLVQAEQLLRALRDVWREAFLPARVAGADTISRKDIRHA